VAEGARPVGYESHDHDDDDDALEEASHPYSLRLVQQLEEMAETEVRFTALGHLQRGGSPSPYDRLLATRLGTRCAELIADGIGGVMVAVRGDECVPVPLKDVAGELRTVPPDHPWIVAGRAVGTCFGD
jgi:ATP-dependent phosphofructokinase / diphosphate-dependent phosphofructokinase